MTDRSNVIGAVHYPITSNFSGRELIRLTTPPAPPRSPGAGGLGPAWTGLFVSGSPHTIVIVIVFWPIMCFPLCPIFVSKKGCM